MKLSEHRPSSLVRPSEYYRPAAPLFRESDYSWMLTRYEDVQEAYRLERQGALTTDITYLLEALRRAGMDVPADIDDVHLNVLFAWTRGDRDIDGNPGRHEVMNGLLKRYFVSKRISDFEPVVRQIARTKLDGHLAGDPGRLDLVRFAGDLSFSTISALVRLPESDEFDLRKHIVNYTNVADFREATLKEPEEVDAFFNQLFVTAPHSGLLWELEQAHDAGTITTRERNSLVWGCWAAGFGTTAAAISLMVGLTLELGHTELVREHLHNPVWVGNYLDEVLRFSTPFPVVTPIATRDLTIGGAEILEGQRVELALSAANRDRAVFGDYPNLFVPGRAAGKHLAFGRGMHRCLGENLAKLEMRVALELLLELPGLELVEWERVAGLTDDVMVARLQYDA